MKNGDFKIAETFWMSGAKWRCTDIGTRTIAAIKLDGRAPSSFDGAPSAVAERMLDEDDIESCALARELLT